jgi:ABC-type transporter Mla subunit MlaD
MSIEDFALRFEGLDDQQIARVHLALNDSVHTVANLKAIIQIVKAELPRLERTLATLESVLATVKTTQERFP